MIDAAVKWLRTRYQCGIILSEQYCATGEVPDVIAWKGHSQSVLVECKISRADFLADAEKPFRKKPEDGLGCERWYCVPANLIKAEELPPGWGLLEYYERACHLTVKPTNTQMRSQIGMAKEMNLLLASLRRVEVRIEPQTITDYLKWKNRIAEYNGGELPKELVPSEHELNHHLRLD
ncbi:MAG TPA: hypothetical protein VGC88_09670 [Terriglobales bacterium]